MSELPSDPLRELVAAAGLDGPGVRLYGVLQGAHLPEPSWQALDHSSIGLEEPPLQLFRAAALAAELGHPIAVPGGLALHALGAAHAGYARVRLVGVDVDAGPELALRCRDALRAGLGVDPVITSGSGRRPGRFWLRFVLDRPVNAAELEPRLLALMARAGIATGKGAVEVYPTAPTHKTTIGTAAVLIGLNGRLPCGLGGCTVFEEQEGQLVARELAPVALAARILGAVASATDFRRLEKSSPSVPTAASTATSTRGRRQRTARVTSDVWTHVRSHLASPREPGQRERPPSGRYTPRRVAQLLPLAAAGQRVDTCLLAYGAARRTGLGHTQAVQALQIWARGGGLRKTRMGQGGPKEPSLEEFIEDGLLRICDAANTGYRPIRTRREPLADLAPSEILNLRRLALRAADETDTSFRAAMTMGIEFLSLQRAARAAGHDDTRLRARRLGAVDPNLGWEELAGGIPQYAKLRAALGIQRTSRHCRGITAAAYSLPYRPPAEALLDLGDGPPGERLERACDALRIDPNTGARHRDEDSFLDAHVSVETRNTSSPRDLLASPPGDGPPELTGPGGVSDSS